MITPAAVPIPNAIMPKAKIPKVSAVKNFSATNFEPTLNQNYRDYIYE